MTWLFNLMRAVRWQRIGLGIGAGAVGALALAISDRLEKQILRDEPVYVPRRMVQRMRSHEDTAGTPSKRDVRLANLLRVTYGAAVGGINEMLMPPKQRVLARGLTTGAALAAAELFLLPRAGAVPQVRAWPRAQLATLVLHTTFFGIATALARRMMLRRVA